MYVRIIYTFTHRNRKSLFSIINKQDFLPESKGKVKLTTGNIKVIHKVAVDPFHRS